MSHLPLAVQRKCRPEICVAGGAILLHAAAGETRRRRRRAEPASSGRLQASSVLTPHSLTTSHLVVHVLADDAARHTTTRYPQQ